MNQTAIRVLIVEDEEPLRMALADALRDEGLDVLEAADGERGLALALEQAPEVILLDLMLPKRDGFSVLQAIREDRLTSAVLIVSARGEEWDRVQGFQYGADDYLVKPFSVQELLLRMHSLLDRIRGATPGIGEVGGRLALGAAIVDFDAFCVERNGQRVGLSRRELELLRFFVRHEGKVITRHQLLDGVWGEDRFPSTRTIDTHVLKLRKKLEEDPENPLHLLTVHGVGYRFVRRQDR